MNNSNRSKVAFVNTEDRKSGVASSIRALNINPVKNKNVLIKPNFNTSDHTPGSTHNETLVALVEEIWEMGAKTVSLGERSYSHTRDVMAQKGAIPLMEKLDVNIVDFDDLAQKDWVKVDAGDSHWQDGFRIARPILESECLVSTCCLKTHQFGGVFTLSLKNHVGVVPTTRHGYDYMRELHASPYQRKLIAEINAPFTPDLIVLRRYRRFCGRRSGERKTCQGECFYCFHRSGGHRCRRRGDFKIFGKQRSDHEIEGVRAGTNCQGGRIRAGCLIFFGYRGDAG